MTRDEYDANQSDSLREVIKMGKGSAYFCLVKE